MADNPQNQTISQEQWQSFMEGMAQQNAALAAQLNAANAHIANTNQQLRRAAVESLEPDKKAEELQKQLDAIQAAGQAAQQITQQQMSNEVWQRRDAEAAARILTLAGMNGNEPGLYRQNWDVNWMPRFVASVENYLQTRRANNHQNANNNPANRANVGNGTGNGLPEIDADKASGAELIEFALQRGNK